MYYVYHIPQRKQWGCTNNLKRRMKRHTQKKGWTINDITQIYTFTDIDEAADMERDLNLHYGYGWNKSRDYRIVTAKASAGGVAAAEINVASGQIAELGRTAMGVEALWKERGITIKRKNGKL
jgi:hypothetical protein